MPTVVSRPATPTFIVSQPVVTSPHPVVSVFGRSGDVVAGVNDYTITQIDPEGATTGDIIVVESGQFVVKTLEIGGEAVQTAAIAQNDIVFFNGSNWINTPFADLFNVFLPIDISGVDAGEVLSFDGSNWINFNLLALVDNVVDNDIAAHVLLTTGVHGLVDTGGGTLFLADDGTYKTVTHPAAPVASVFGRTGIVVAVGGDYALADITGLTAAGPGTNFLADDGTYKLAPAAPVSSVFGRSGVVVAANNDYTLPQISGLTDAGGGADFLADDGLYKAIVHPPDAVDSVFGRTGTVAAANNDYTLPQIDGLIDSGGGTDFLADDGTYKVPPGRRDVISPSVADGTTITNAFQTVFDFSPDTVFRNNNCLITIHYQAMNIGGPATWGAHLQSLIGFTVQQNAYGAGVAQTVNASERASFTVTMEGIVSAAGNIQIQSFADVRDHDFANAAANGKTRLTIELV